MHAAIPAERAKAKHLPETIILQALMKVPTMILKRGQIQVKKGMKRVPISLGVAVFLLLTIADSTERVMHSKFHTRRFKDTVFELVRRTLEVQHALATRKGPVVT
jgi:hypothetical protein